MSITLHPPTMITSRLLPGVRIGDAEVSIEYSNRPANGRQRYWWYIDLDGQEFSGDDLRSRVGGGTLQEGLASLLSFLGAFAEAHEFQQRTGRESENADLFPAELAEWAVENSDEVGSLAIELEETPDLIVEEGR